MADAISGLLGSFTSMTCPHMDKPSTPGGNKLMIETSSFLACRQSLGLPAGPGGSKFAGDGQVWIKHAIINLSGIDSLDGRHMGTSKNQAFFVRARKPRAENRSVWANT